MIAGIGALLRLSWRQDRRKLAVACLLMAGSAVAMPLAAAWLRTLTNDVIADRPEAAALDGAVVAFFAIGAVTLAHFAHIAYFEVSELNVLTMDERLFSIAHGRVELEYVEDPSYADDMTLLRQEIQRLGDGLQALLVGASVAVSLIVTGVLLASVDPLLLLLPLLALPSLLTGRRAQSIIDSAREAAATDIRTAQHLVRLATAAQSAKEVRILRLADQIRLRHKAAWTAASRHLTRGYVRGGIWQAGGQLAFSVGYVAGLYLVIRDAVVGHGSVGGVVLAVVLSAQVNQQVAAAFLQIQHLQRAGRAFARLDRLRVRSGLLEPVESPGLVPEALTGGIELRGVSFCYPGSATPVLSDIDLRLPAGSTVAFVGENGAGKTTLVKLLCRLYKPTGGRILVDGTDLAAIDARSWLERIATGFQDFVRFEFDVRETVGVGDLPRCSDDEAVLAALDRASTAAMVDDLAHGLDTRVGKSRAGGAELSGGQWQRLALGRAMMRESPLLLVLDEPTSALDAEAEHRLFSRYAHNAARLGRRNGAITVLVSHRFSTVRMADLIVVVAGGRVKAAGTHDELMACDGVYAELYGVQAAAYS